MTRLPLLSLAAVSVLVVAATAGARPFPDVIDLPDGFRPEGIAVGQGHTFYVGSIPTGAILVGDLRTGEIGELVPPQPARAAIGIEVDERGRIFVAGGPTGDAYVYDAGTGDPLAAYELAGGSSPTFVNDLVVTNDAVWLTDSRRAVLYRLPLGPNGTLPDAAETLLLSGLVVDPTANNLNGIEATPNGQTLIAVQSNSGLLHRIDPATGETNVIELTGGDGNVLAGDGLLLDGRTLYVVQNRLNKIAVIELAPDFFSGQIVRYITDAENFHVPTTLAEHGNRLFAVNARFGVPNPDAARYWVTQVPK